MKYHPPSSTQPGVVVMLSYLTEKIFQADRTLERLDKERERLSSHPAKHHEKTAEIGNWLARRRALIDVWEYATNRVWVAVAL